MFPLDNTTTIEPHSLTQLHHNSTVSGNSEPGTSIEAKKEEEVEESRRREGDDGAVKEEEEKKRRSST